MSNRKAKTIKSLKDLTLDPANINKGTAAGAELLDRSLANLGAGRSALADADGTIIAGNKTITAAKKLDMPVRVVQTDGKEIVIVQRMDMRFAGSGKERETARQMAAIDNESNRQGYDPDVEILIEQARNYDYSFIYPEGYIEGLIADLTPGGIGGVTGDDSPSEGIAPEEARKTLADRFLVPPFSVLDARQGYWQDRKRAWLALGIQSELGRGDASPGGSQRDAAILGDDGKTVRGDGSGKPIKNGLLGESEQARTHYSGDSKINKLAPGGTGKNSAWMGQRTAEVEAKYAKGASNLGRSNGQDLMRGEHTVGGVTMRLDQRSAAHANGTNKENIPGYYWKKERGMSDDEIIASYEANGGGTNVSGTSIFDPVLCELAYRWFSPPDAAILDPFAGGSVRGIVAAMLGRNYTGIDLRAEQIAANETQAKQITPERLPRWITGDSRNSDTLAAGEYDFIFSCPPYADLEVYSDNPLDLSTMKYDDFLKAYDEIIFQAVGMLKANRFACFVVGDVRDKKGFYRNFVSDTIRIFEASGARLYNEAILVTSVGSLPIRVGRQFEAGRKLGKTHQNVLVFCKGDPKKATADCGAVEVYDPAESFGEVVD